ncbi:MAG: DUF2157 domain-containing protein, partial [Deltaproteobacteria bacterium]|nr:DUF2157 domain-containing protein [Deltaproteobacteria bacterium]
MEGTLSPEAYEAALRFLGIRPGPRHWSAFWRRVLAFGGVLFFAFGVICFFAHNWAAMHHFSKFALIAACILVSGLCAVWRGLDSLPGKLALVLAAICIGPLLAVYGQTYQTGADAWELFRAWTLVLVPLALAGRQAALWLLVWLAGSAWGGMYLGGFHIPEEPEFLLAQSMCLAAWEIAARHWENNAAHRWLEATWLPRIIGFTTLFVLNLHLAAMIMTGRLPDPAHVLFLPGGGAHLALYACLLPGGWLWYRKRRPDLFMLSCGLFSLASLLFCVLVKVCGVDWDAGSLLVSGLCIAGITAACGHVLRRLHQTMEAEKAARPDPQPCSPEFFEKIRTPCSWDALWDHVREARLLTGDPPPIPDRSAAPWYIAAQLALGGWIAALFLICFLGFFLFTTLSVHSMEGPLFTGGLCFLILAGWLMRRDAVFTEQFALALALAGTMALAGAVVLAASERLMPVAAMPLVIGLIISIMQATTQINEQTLVVVAKIVATMLSLIFFGPYML